MLFNNEERHGGARRGGWTSVGQYGSHSMPTLATTAEMESALQLSVPATIMEARATAISDLAAGARESMI
jgi:hypothetical protein